MRLLLDPCALLWYYLDDPQLSAAARNLIDDPGNVKLVSPASHWEVAIKVSLGRYTLTVPFPQFVREAVFDNGFVVLPIEPAHTAGVVGLPHHHRDPFDRLLIAQGMAEGVPVLTPDVKFAPYPVRRLW